MFCPLLWIAKPEVDIGLSSEHDCLKEECAWWNKGEEACEILILGCAIEAISDSLEDIEMKMPPGQPFVK